MHILYVVLLVVLSAELFAQTGIVSRGPFVVSEHAFSIYGKNNRLFVLSDGGVWYTDNRIEWKKSTYAFYFVNSFTKDRDGNLYACSDVSIYKSADNGETWSDMLFSLKDDVTGETPQSTFLKYSISKDTLFIGSSRGIGYVVEGNLSGTLLHQFAGQRTFAIAADHNLVVALTNDGIKVSVDRGATWKARSGPFFPQIKSKVAVSNKKIFATTSSDLYYSDDFGVSWHLKSTDFAGSVVDLEVDHGKFYAVGDHPYFFSEEDDKWISVGSIEKVNSIAVSGDHIFVTEEHKDLDQGHFFESSSAGNSWNEVTLNGYTSDRTDAIAMDADSTIYLGTTTGIYKKAKGSAVFQKFINLPSGTILIEGDFLYAANQWLIVKYNKSTGENIESYAPDFASRPVDDFIKIDDNIITQVSDDLWKVDVTNNSVSAADNDLPESGELHLLQQNSGTAFILCNGGIYKWRVQLDFGWQKISSPATVGSIASLLVNDNTVLITGHAGAISHDNGATWSTINAEDQMTNLKYGNGLYYATGLGRAYISDNDGETWLSKDLGDLQPWSLLPTKDSVYFGTVGSGVYSFKRRPLQNIIFDEIQDKAIEDAPFALNATTTSGLPVTFVANDNVSIASGIATIVKAGFVSIRAEQAGTDMVDAAVSVTRSFCINPATPVITQSNNEDGTVKLTSSSGTNNLWYRNEVPISNATESIYVADASGDYTVQTFAETCLSDISAAVTLDIVAPETVTGIDEFTDRATELYPNPADDEIFIRTNAPGRVAIVDLTGRIVESREANQEVRFETRWLSRGIYFARIEAGGILIIRRFIKK